LKKQLGGKLDLAVTQGALRDPELARKIEAAVAFLKGREPNPPGEELIFDSLTGTAVIDKGVLQNDDLRLITPLILAKGQGSASLVNETADYTVSVGLAGDETKTERIFVPITMKGPFAKLQYGLDLEKVAKQRLQKEVDKHKEKAQEKLDAEIQKREGDLKQELQKKLGDKFKLF
jgi:AsmA protein